MIVCVAEAIHGKALSLTVSSRWKHSPLTVSVLYDFEAQIPGLVVTILHLADTFDLHGLVLRVHIPIPNQALVLIIALFDNDH